MGNELRLRVVECIATPLDDAHGDPYGVELLLTTEGRRRHLFEMTPDLAGILAAELKQAGYEVMAAQGRPHLGGTEGGTRRASPAP